MNFDSKKFLKTKWAPRTEDCPVPDLQMFFPEGVKAVWKVRGLTGQELGRANEAAERNKNVGAILERIAGGDSKDKAKAVLELAGVDVKAPDDIAKRIEIITMGSVDPVCPQDLAVRMCEAFPIEFYQITNMILRLTGQGQLPGKQKASGEITESGQASPSDTPEGDSSTS